MKSYVNFQNYENYILVKFSDMIDLCIALMECDLDLALLEFLIDLFPEGINDENIQEYFNTYTFQSSEQIKEFMEKTRIILEISAIHQKTNNIKKSKLNSYK